MKILLHEFITGGGFYSLSDELPSGSLLHEGSAMLAALVADFAALPNVEVTLQRDARLPAIDNFPGCIKSIQSAGQELDVLREQSATADWTLLIAPEFSGLLAARAKLVIEAGGRLLGPSPEFIAIAADKSATIDRLARAGVPTTQGIDLTADESLPDDFEYPAVLKPRNGAGSCETRLIHRRDLPLRTSNDFEAWRLEKYHSGQPASISFLCGQAGNFPLLPCWQQLSDDGRFQYLGGSLMRDVGDISRAVKLAEHAIKGLPKAFGYIGIDLILGDDPSGNQDVVVEVNPRLTTSYVGLRAASRQNLAAQMLAIANGERLLLNFSSGEVEFRADGVCSAD